MATARCAPERAGRAADEPLSQSDPQARAPTSAPRPPQPFPATCRWHSASRGLASACAGARDVDAAAATAARQLLLGHVLFPRLTPRGHFAISACRPTTAPCQLPGRACYGDPARRPRIHAAASPPRNRAAAIPGPRSFQEGPPRKWRGAAAAGSTLRGGQPYSFSDGSTSVDSWPRARSAAATAPGFSTCWYGHFRGISGHFTDPASEREHLCRIASSPRGARNLVHGEPRRRLCDLPPRPQPGCSGYPRPALRARVPSRMHQPVAQPEEHLPPLRSRGRPRTAVMAPSRHLVDALGLAGTALV